MAIETFCYLDGEIFWASRDYIPLIEKISNYWLVAGWLIACWDIIRSTDAAIHSLVVVDQKSMG